MPSSPGLRRGGFRLEKDHEADAVLLTPKNVLALWHRVTTEQDGLELTFQSHLRRGGGGDGGDGHVSEARDVRVVVLGGLFPDAPALRSFFSMLLQEPLVSLAARAHGSWVKG